MTRGDLEVRPSEARPSEARPSEARTRLLNTAIKIFYAEGIHSVGVDRIIAEAKVTRATFYRHFPGKEDLIVAYLREVHQMDRSRVEAAITADASPVEPLLAIAGSIAENIQSPGFRGCAFLNAAAEYPETGHPVHREIIAHRQWFLDTLTTLMAQVHEGTAGPAARHFVMLRDGAMAAGCLFDPALVSDTFLSGIEGLLRVNTERQSAESARR
ncbi:TetR/AcrR family transcriptional regulator [Actinoplanes sp. M2I2]|uniref:TetR/AcrR family transcriptional regulator n=1 Tax=Actinoplanes sp. M2I2 TaxID=1734444 RepID=UPI0020229A70|nr:TetR/AcrR family transcriptional regulator [Actinoplanes sp. M2I2]